MTLGVMEEAGASAPGKLCSVNDLGCHVMLATLKIAFVLVTLNVKS